MGFGGRTKNRLKITEGLKRVKYFKVKIYFKVNYKINFNVSYSLANVS